MIILPSPGGSPDKERRQIHIHGGVKNLTSVTVEKGPRFYGFIHFIRLDLLLHLLLFNTRGLSRLLRHRLPTSSQLFINLISREVDRD